jgi:hypothetical protein
MTQIPPSQRSYSLLAVGKPYHPDLRVWSEGADYNFRDGAHELRVFLPRASKAEITSVEEGPIEFGLWWDWPDLFVLSQFHDKRSRRLVMSFDCPYTWHRLAPEDRVKPPAWEEVNPALRAVVNVVLIEATSGIVLALRICTYSPEFTRALHRTIADQAAMPYDKITHESRIEDITREFTSEQLWDRCVIRCHSGD